MDQFTLCRERLFRLFRVIDQRGGSVTYRNLIHSHGILFWEIDQAAEQGFVEILTRKPPIGRPSYVVKILSRGPSAKLPPFRWFKPRRLSSRQYQFVRMAASIAYHANSTRLQFATDAYLAAYPRAKSRAGAAASASRLFRDPFIRAAWYWYLRDRFVPRGELMPGSAASIYRRLRELGAFD